MITLIGPSTGTVVVGEAFTDPGATALDNIDGDLTAQIVTVNPVDVNQVGGYTITYDVSDSAGNTSEASGFFFVDLLDMDRRGSRGPVERSSTT